MTIEAVLYTRLSTFAGLTALVATRVYPLAAPQNVTAPYLTYRRVSAIRESAMGADANNVTARFQIDVWASSFASARNVAEQVRLAMQRWTNATGTTVDDTFIENQIDLYDPEIDTFHIAVDIRTHYRE